ncbi:MAG: hypothetical protein IPM29_15560 [Planctomycetes bacterium]|nr:hypothetical protein [Planctomycetota bacterium]
MRSLYTLAAIAALSVAASAQLSLTTTFANNNGGAAGGAVYFNLTALTSINVVALDINTSLAVGNPASLDVYLVPGGTWVGNASNAAYWGTPILAGQAYVGAGVGQPSNVVFSSALPLAAGQYAVALVNNGAAHAYTTGGTGFPLTYADANLQLDLGGASNVPFTGTPFSPRVWNGTVYYTLGGGGTFARASASGTGCGAAPLGDGTFYELFDGIASNFDLSNTGFTLNWTGNGYAFVPGASAIVPPTGAGPIALGDDQTVAVQLPFSLPSPQGLNNRVWLCSNGFMSFQSTTNADFSESVAELLSAQTRLCFLWDDLNPGAGGTVDGEVDVNGVFHITFTNVPEFGGTNQNNVQVSLQSNGTIEVKYGSIALLDCLVGLSTGNGATDPGGIDISAASPFMFTTGFAQAALGLAVVDRPIIGTTANTQVSGIRPATALAGAMNYGTPFPTPLDLTALRAPGCLIYTQPLFSQGFATGAPTALVGIPIPNLPVLVGVSLDQQAAVADFSYNALGVATSGVVTWLIGDV